METRSSLPRKRVRMTCAFGHLSVAGSVQDHAQEQQPARPLWMEDEHDMPWPAVQERAVPSEPGVERPPVVVTTVRRRTRLVEAEPAG